MSFSGRIEYLIQELSEATASTKDDVERFRIKFLGSKGVFKELFNEFKQVSSDEKRQFGKQLNELKAKAEGQFSTWSEEFSQSSTTNESPDLTRPGMTIAPGAHHPISIIKDEIIDIFHAIGFSVAEGPEIEDDWHNFSALNFPPEHPGLRFTHTHLIRSGAYNGKRKTAN